MLPHDLGVCCVHCVEIRHALEKDVDVHGMIQVGPDGFQHHLERSQDLPRLRRDIGPRQLPGRRIHARGATNPMCSPTFAT